MKNDYEVKLYMSERRKGMTQQQAAARAGMSERIARKYEQAGALPSALKRPHDWPTRANPFEEVGSANTACGESQNAENASSNLKRLSSLNRPFFSVGVIRQQSLVRAGCERCGAGTLAVNTIQIS